MVNYPKPLFCVLLPLDQGFGFMVQDLEVSDSSIGFRICDLNPLLEPKSIVDPHMGSLILSIQDIWVLDVELEYSVRFGMWRRRMAWGNRS